MPIEPLPSGRWRVRLGRKRVLLGTFDTEDKARAMHAAALSEIRSGRAVPVGRLTLGQHGAGWFDRRELRGHHSPEERVKGLKGERQLWARHVEPSDLCAMPVRAIRRRDVDDYVDWLGMRTAVQSIRSGLSGTRLVDTGRPLSSQRRKHALALVQMVIADAVAREIIGTNIADHARVKVRSRDVREDWLRAHEIDALLGCENLCERDRAGYACAIGLGPRLNDLKKIRLSDVCLAANGPHVLMWINKSERQHRVPVLPWLRPHLERHIATLPEGSTLLFPGDDGEAYAPSFCFNWPAKKERTKNGMRRRPSALEIARVDRKIRFHDLRGTTATHLALGTWGRRWSLVEIQQMLAHSDQRVTERYVKRALDHLDAAAAATRGGPSGGVPTTSPTARASAGNDSQADGLLSRRSEIRILPGAPALTGSGVGTRGHAEARNLLLSVAAGHVTQEQVDALVGAVLGAPDFALALEVQAGGPLAVRRAVALAGMLLDAAQAALPASQLA